MVLTHLNSSRFTQFGPPPVTILICVQLAFWIALKQESPSEVTVLPSFICLFVQRSISLRLNPSTTFMLIRIGFPSSLREIAEEKEQSKSQEDILAEESIYSKFTSNKDTSLFPAWHSASWSDKLKMLDRFEDDRLIGFGKKIIYQESPETLPENILKNIKREIAKRILSEKKEKWWTCKEFYYECDNLRDKYTNENDKEKLKFLDQLDEFVMSIQKKYENV